MANNSAKSGNNWQQNATVPTVESMPGKPFRSVLEPHFEMLQRLRRERKTWREIAEILEAEKGLKIHYTAIQKFFSRKVHGKVPLGFEDGPPPIPSVSPRNETTTRQKLTDEELEREFDQTPPPSKHVPFTDPFQ